MRRLGLLVVLLTVVAGCGGEDRSSQRSSPAGPTTSGSAEGVELAGETLDGSALSLADLRGTPVFVNVWASW